MTTARKSAKKTPAKKTSAKKSPAKKSSQTSRCWPGFEPTPGSMPGAKGSCKPKAGKQSVATKRADQKAAAASKLQKAGK